MSYFSNKAQNRESALSWWRSLTQAEKETLVYKYCPEKSFMEVASSSMAIESLFIAENKVENTEVIDNITKYTIIKSLTSEALEQQVKSFLKLGWKLQGGICVASYKNTTYYLQAIIKE